MSKPIIYYNNAFREAQTGTDGTKYATAAKAIQFPLDDFKVLGVTTPISDTALASMVGAQLVFDATTNRYNITGITAYPGANPKNFYLNSICWSGSLLVAVGEADGTDSYIVTSPDGSTWTERSPTVAKNKILYSICWSGSLFVAVGDADGTDSYILTSPDGITWTERSPTVAKNVGLLSVCWSGSLFVAVGQGDGTDSYILTSPDGITWTERAPTVAKNKILYSVVWSGALFVAVGTADGTDSYILTSADGTTWTEQAPTVAKNKTLYSICWSGSLFVAVGEYDGADTYILTSSDGITWTERAPAVAKAKALYSVCWSGSSFLAVGQADGSNAYMLMSSDGITWTEKDNPKNIALNEVTFFNNLFIAVGDADGTDAYIVITPDCVIYPDYALSLFERLQTVDIGDGFSIQAGLTCAQQDTTRIAPYAADNSLSPVMKGLVNTGMYLRSHAPNLLKDGGFESGAFSPNWTAEAVNPWVIESATELEGAYSASWDLVASKYLRQSGTGKLERGVTYRLVYKTKSVTADPTVGAVTINLFQTTSGTAVDADAAGTQPTITTAGEWQYIDFTPDFTTDDWYLNIAGDHTKANGATEITVDEFYLYKKPTMNTLIIGRHNLVGKGSLVVKSYKMSPLRSTVAAADYTEIAAAFTVTTADVFSKALTESYDPVVELYIPATASFTPEIGDLYIGDGWSMPRYPQAPLDPYRTNSEGQRELTLQFRGLIPAYRTTNIKDLLAKLKASEAIWVKIGSDDPIMMTSPQGARESAYNPYAVDLDLALVEVP